MRKWVCPGITWRLLLIALLFAGASTLLIFRVWNPHQPYPDVVTGTLTYQDLSKSKELTLLLWFIVSSVAFYYLLLRLIASNRTATVTERANLEQSGWLIPLLDVPIACLAYWVGFQLVHFDWTSPPIESLAAAGVLCVVLLGLRRFSSLPRLVAQRIGLWILFDLLLLVFGGFGIGMMAAFALPARELRPGSIALLYVLCGLCFLIAILWRSATPARLMRRLIPSTYIFADPGSAAFLYRSPA